MRFRSEKITAAIDELIFHEGLQIVFLYTKYGIEKSNVKNEPTKVDELERKLKNKAESINATKDYLKSLRNRISENQSEESLQSLLKEVESIEVKAGFVRQRLVQDINSPARITIRTELEDFNKVVQSLQTIHNELTSLLHSTQSVKTMNHTVTVGVPDDKQQITSPAIQKFTKESIASNHEVFPDNQPTALVDFQRSITVNGIKFPRAIKAEELKTSLMEFLNASESIRMGDPNARDALCNAMLKNGQALQTVFLHEYEYDTRTSPLSKGTELCMPAETVPYYNWYLNKKGELSVDIQLDVKSVIDLTGPSTFPLIADIKTGEIREIDPEQDDIAHCPTILKYQATVTFDTKNEVRSLEDKEPTSETVAVPHVSDHTVTVFHDQFQYTPTLTAFEQLETAPKQATPSPSVDK